MINSPEQMAEQRVLPRAGWELYQHLLAENEDCGSLWLKAGNVETQRQLDFVARHDA